MSRLETLTALLEDVAARRPEAQALASLTRPPVSYAGFAAQARRVAEGLSRQGIGPGDRIAVMLPNRPEYLVLLFAAARLGATVIHVNTRYRAEEVSYLLDRARPTAIVTAWGFAAVDFPGLLGELLPDTRAPLRFVVGLDAGGASSLAGLPVIGWPALDAMPERQADDADPDAACLTFTTSGTTAGPKLVLHRQRSIAWHAQDVAEALGTAREGAAVLAALPLCGTFGLALAMAGIAGGAKIVCLDRFEPLVADSLIRAHGVTHLAATDDMLFRLADAANGRPYAPFAFTGFASFHPGAERILERCGPLNMAPRGVYGSSEVQALFSAQDPADPERARQGGGLPMSPQAEVRARGEDGALADHGALEFRGPSLFDGYLNNPEATARAMTEDGFYRSGDLGRLHPGGGFDYEARLGDALRLGGFLVAPEEMEAFLKGLPGVKEAQVVGIEGGTVAVAFVLPEDGAAPEEEALRAACAERLAAFKVPARILAIEAFPVTDSPNGVKIQRVKLREMAEAAMATPAAG
jgi:fatty-acyl-CoA synthase